MKKIILLILLALPLYGFSQLKLSGSVKDTEDYVGFANVIVTDEANRIITGSMTEKDGLFEFELPRGTYTLSVNHLGYESYEKNIVLEKKMLLDPIILNKKMTMLEEVVVFKYADLIRRKLDKTVFAVENSPLASMGTSFEALQRAPGLVIKNDEIVMLGKSGVKIMIDGKPLYLAGQELKNYLTTLPANEIKEIEIISNPSSRYEAEGNSGIVNIIFKRLRENSWNNTTSLSYKQAKYGKQSVNNSFSYKKDKINLTLSAGYDFGLINADQRIQIHFPEEPLILQTIHKENADDFHARAFVDYSINESNKIGLQYLGTFLKSDLINTVNTEVLTSQDEVISHLRGNGKIMEHKNNHSFNIFYETRLDTLGKRIIYNVDFFNHDRKLGNFIVSEQYDSGNILVGDDFINNSNVNQTINNYNAKIDVDHPSKFALFQYGAKVSFIDTENRNSNTNSTSSDPAFNFTDHFTYKENIQAVYVNGTKKLGSNINLQLGLRGEYTQIKGQSDLLGQVNKSEYLKFFPNFMLAFEASEKNLYSLNGGKRIERPGYSMLNPFRNFISSKVSSEGNPLLQPAYVDYFEVSHTYNNNFNTKFSLNRISNAFDDVFNLDPISMEQRIKPENYYNNYDYSLIESFQLELLPWWKTQNTLFFNYSDSKKTVTNFNAIVRDGFEFYGSFNNQFTLNKKKNIIGEFNFWYNSPFNNNVRSYSAASALDIGFSYQSVIKNLNLSAGVFDIFNTSPRKLVSDINGVNQSYIAYRDNRYFRISLSYVFGSKKISATEKEFGNEEERRRSY